MPFIGQAGYLPVYKDQLDSDHRWCFVDLNNRLIDNIIETKRPPKRNIEFKALNKK